MVTNRNIYIGIDFLENMTRERETNNDGRVFRDRIAEVGQVAGTLGGLVYGLITEDRTAASIIASTGAGAVVGSGLAYCVGTIAKAIRNYE